MEKEKLKTFIVKNIKSLLVIIAIVAATVTLSTYLIEKEIHAKRIKVSGTIEGDEVRLSFRVDGQILELLTDEGEVVKKGDIIARLNTDELSRTHAEAAAALRAAEYDYTLAKIDYERAENLLAAGAIPAQQRDDAKTKHDASNASVEQNKASLELAETRLGFTQLSSPIDSIVLLKSSLAGEVVQPGTPVFTVIDLNNLWVTAYLNETDLARVKLGQQAYVTTDTYPHKKYKGWVSFISSEAEFTPKFIQTTEERVKLVYRIKVRVDNSSLELKPGMPADAYIIE
jgi:HlyD family secretion protein